MALNDILAALRGAPTTIRELDKQLAKAYAERTALRNAPPHTDDIVDWFTRGLDAASTDALGRLTRWHLNKDALGSWSGETFSNNPGPSILALTQVAPNHTTPAPTGSTPDLAMLTHLLRPVIEPQLRKLVADACGSAFDGGLRASDRVAKLAKVEKRIADLEAQRREWVEGLEEARRHVAGTENIQGVTDADVAAEVAAYERATGERVGA
jgi:hypothetical protein